MPEIDSSVTAKQLETTPCDSREEELDARRYSLQFIGIFGALLSAIAVFNYVVDPYAHYQVGVIPPAVQLTRTVKVQGIEKSAPIATGLILGSSRVLKMEPEFLQSIDGEIYYNAGVNYAKPEDCYALTKLYYDRCGKFPKKVIIGIDVASFNENLPADPELVGLHALTKYLDGKVTLPSSPGRWQELISFQYTKNSLRSIRHYLHESNNQAEHQFVDNGMIVYTKREAAIQNSTYDFQAAIDYNKQEYAEIFTSFDRIGEARWSLLEELVRTLRAAGTEVNLFLTPDHPQLVQTLSAIPNYEARTTELNQRLQTLSDELSLCYVNLQSIESFGGEAQYFVDGIHPLEPNTRKMVGKIFREEDEEVTRAIQ